MLIGSSVAQRTAHQPPESADPGVSYGNARPTLVSGAAPSRTLTERLLEAHNFSMDPWECTGSALQGWETHLQRSIVPIQGYPAAPWCHYTSLPAFGSVPEETSGGSVAVAPVAKAAPACLGCATQPESIFARAPVCNHTCSYCFAQPCDGDMEHDDHTCYGCEQRKLNPAGEPNTPWRAPKLLACDQLCNQCSRKKRGLRYLRDIHACYWCSLHPGCVPTPLGVGTRIPLDVLVKKLRIDERKMRE